MSHNDQNDDAPDIPPAVSAANWASLDAPRVRTSPAVRIRVENDAGGYPQLTLTTKDGSEICFRDVSDLAVLLAFVNHVLIEKDDPRSFTHAIVEHLRKAADVVEQEAFRPEERDRALALLEFADALESMLPPKREAE